MEKNKKIIIASGIVSVMVLFIGIAFAALASQLNVSFGNVTQNAISWNVGFKGSSVTPTQDGTSSTGLSCGTASVTPSTVTISDSTLSKPGDKCTYPLTIENKGDIAANLAAITMIQPTNITCTNSDESTMVCGNITIKLKTESGLDFSSGITINSGEEYDLKLVIQYTGQMVSSETLTIGNSKVSFTYTQAANRVSTPKPDGVKDAPKPICKRATILHTDECKFDQYGCYAAGYYEGGSKGTTTITYGSLGVKGILTPGDAFDCDVNGDGDYDADTERFYYVSGLDGDDKSEYAVLNYYTNVTAGEPIISLEDSYMYYSEDENEWGPAEWPNIYGPTIAYKQLPSIIQWKNVQLSNNTRQIYAENGAIITDGGNLPKFTYTNTAARLLSYKEVNKACGITIGNSLKGELDNCEFLLEHSMYADWDNEAYWIETPISNSDYEIWYINAYYRYVYIAATGNKRGVRPAIEVLKTDIDY